jgi:branched-chain amino acid transport system permease protein
MGKACSRGEFLALLGQYFGNGLVLGCIYALMALGLTLVFGYMNVVNFAHGEFYMLGAFLGYSIAVSGGLPFGIALLGAALGVGAVGLVVDRLLLRKLRGHGEIALPMLATIGLSIALQNLATIIWNPIPKAVGSPIHGSSMNLGIMRLTPQSVLVILVAGLCILLAHLFIGRTRLGRAMRATFQDPVAAWLQGVNVDVVYGLTFAFGAALAAVAGVLISTVFQITPTMGSLASAKAFAVVILGGLGSFPGAILGGLLLGVAESLAAGYVSSGYQDAVGLLTLLAVLMVRPQGLLGGARTVQE